MKISDILAQTGSALTKTVSRLRLKAETKSPEILLGIGIISGAAAIVTACIATKKVDDIIEEHNEQLDALEKTGADEKLRSETKAKIFITTGLKIAGLYAPTVILEAVSGGCAVASYKITDKRLQTMSSLFMRTDQAFRAYRGAVISRFGKEIDEQLRFGEPAKQITDGSEKQEISKEDKPVSAVYDPVVFVIKRGDRLWNEDREYMYNALKMLECEATNCLRAKSYLRVSDILEKMGEKLTPESFILSWVIDRSKYRYIGDEPSELPLIGEDYVSFSLDSPSNYDFFDGGDTDECRLIFNVHGNIYDLTKGDRV